MYEAYYHMQSKAFPAQPTPAVFFESRIHQGAFHYLTTGVEEHEPFLLLLGRYGMGKTLLCLRLLRHLRKEEHPFLNIPTPVVSYRELLEHILHSWGVTPLGDSDESLQTQLFHYMDRHLTPGRHFSIVLDEVQDYQLSTLAKIRMLSNYNCDGFYPFQFIFFGHPDVLELLNTPPLASLHQRIRRRYTLTPFSFEETREYIYYRLLESGARGSPYFPDDTLRIIHARSEGIPRLINNLCDTCLLIGAAKASSAIDRQTALDAAENLGLAAPQSVSDIAEDILGTGVRTTVDEDKSEDEEPAAASPAEASGEDSDRADAEDQAKDRNRSKQALRIAAQILPPWAWRTVGALLIFLLGGILTLRISRLIRPDAPPPKQSTNSQHQQPANAQPQNQGQEPRQEQIGAESNRLQSKSESAPADQGRQTADPASPADPLPGMPSNRNDATASTPDSEPASAQHGLLGYFRVKNSDLDLRRHNTDKLSETITDTIAQTDETTPINTTMGNTAGGAATEAANTDAHPFSLQLHTAAERRQTVEMLWHLREQGIPELHVGRIHDRNGSPVWAVLQGHYSDESQARKAKKRLQQDGATPAKTPYAVEIPVADTDDDTIRKYLREAGFWPYSIPNFQNGDRLLVGAFETRELAENWKQEMETRGFEAQAVSR